MPRFAANLTMMFTELPFLDRFEAARKEGFEAVEFLFPYDFDTAEIRRRLDDQGLTLVLHNLPAGNWAAGERGIGCHPDRIPEFREGAKRAVETATALKAERLNCLAGIAPAGADRARLRATLVDNLGFAAELIAATPIRFVIEPINPYDIPGFFLNRTDEALAIVREVGPSKLAIQYDIYHAQRTEGELAATIEKTLAHIGHMQLADNPGRNEPGTGEICWPFLFGRIDALGYDGWIGCEYRPKAGTVEGLGWRTAQLG